MTSGEFRERVLGRARKADVAITSDVAERLEAYYRLLARWNSKINLTAFPLDGLSDRAVDRLLIEPLAAARFVPESPLVWFDLGSGGGSPAIPLKIVRSAACLTMIESKVRKAAFLHEAVRTLELSGATVEHARVEEVAGRLQVQHSAQLVTVRAMHVDRELLEVVSMLLAPDGRLFLFTSNVARIPTSPRFGVVRTGKLAGRSSRLVILRS